MGKIYLDGFLIWHARHISRLEVFSFGSMFLKLRTVSELRDQAVDYLLNIESFCTKVCAIKASASSWSPVAVDETQLRVDPRVLCGISVASVDLERSRPVLETRTSSKTAQYTIQPHDKKALT